jgi:TolB protein
MVVCSGLLALALTPGLARAQDWLKTGTGIGVEKVKVAVSPFGPAGSISTALAQEFGDVVRADLDYSGIIDPVSPSFFPQNTPHQPSELDYQAWSTPPASTAYLAFGSLNGSGNDLAVQAWFYDVRNPGAQAMIAKIYRGQPSDAQVRLFAHQFADEILKQLSAGLPGIGTTQIAFISSRTGAKEVWVMDYDAQNQHQLTSLGSVALTPRWSPDGSRIAFSCLVAGRSGVQSFQICMYSMASNRLLSWPRWGGTNCCPSWSPDGDQVIFMSGMSGSPELYVADSSGNHPKRLTFTAGVNTSAAWNPKTGQQIVFVSDRGGVPQLYMMDASGGDVQKLDLGDKGYVVDPSWSPNGELLAFSWRRPDGNYDLYLYDIGTRQMAQLTHDTARNERPCWAPDGRHIVFESTRTGTRQIWSMLADGSEQRQLTRLGTNESPSWSPPR